MSDEFEKKLKDIMKKTEAKKDNLENILKDMNLSLDEIFIKVFNVIIYELKSLNEIIFYFQNILFNIKKNIYKINTKK